jgi:hypothetical protein
LIHDYLVEALGAPRSEAKVAARLSLGRPALAARFIEEKEFYQGYRDKTSAFLDLFSNDINQRLSAVASLAEKDDDEDKADKTLRILSIWQGAVRDMLLLASNNGDIIQHEDQRDRLLAAKEALGMSGVLKAFALLKKGEEYVRANVNPKLVLENIAINIK